ncbi:MAG: hypothetical protein ACLPKB_15670 [Xanthobacteraceae bacterium]
MQIVDRGENPYRAVRSLIAVVADWWRSRRAYPEESRIAHDLGIDASELREIVRRGRNSASLLPQRMAALHLDATELARSDGLLLRDLQRVCALCDSKGRCMRDLARDPNDPAWEEYCPNEGTLNALKAWMPGRQT